MGGDGGDCGEIYVCGGDNGVCGCDPGLMGVLMSQEWW